MRKYSLSAFAVMAVVVLFGLVMATCAYQFDADMAVLMFSEDGFLEQASPLIWFAASLFLFWKCRGRETKYLIFAITLLLLAGREWDLHKAFTSDSFLKINFYKQTFGLEQFFGGMAALFFIGMLTATVVNIVRDTIFKGGFKLLSGQLLMAGFGLIALSKVLDRIPSVLRHEHGIVLSFRFDLMLQSLEEGYEFFAPILIFAAFIIYFRQESLSNNLKNSPNVQKSELY